MPSWTILNYTPPLIFLTSNFMKNQPMQSLELILHFYQFEKHDYVYTVLYAIASCCCFFKKWI